MATHADEDVLPPEEYANVDQGAFKGAHVVTNSEMSLILSRVLQDKRQRHPTWQPPAVMQVTVAVGDQQERDADGGGRQLHCTSRPLSCRRQCVMGTAWGLLVAAWSRLADQAGWEPPWPCLLPLLPQSSPPCLQRTMDYTSKFTLLKNADAKQRRRE